MVRTCSTHERDEIHTKFWSENPKERDHLGDLAVYGKISEWFLREIRWEGATWMHLTQDTDQWRALVNSVMDHLVP